MRCLGGKSSRQVERRGAEEGEALQTDDDHFKGEETSGKTDIPRPSSGPFQCKPELSCWNILPETFTKKWTKLRR